MATSIRIKDDVFSLLEINAKGYESVSDTIKRSVFSLEVLEALDMASRQTELSILTLKEEGLTRNKTILMHYQPEAIEQAMDLVKKLYPDYVINYKIETNVLNLLVELPK